MLSRSLRRVRTTNLARTQQADKTKAITLQTRVLNEPHEAHWHAP
jgi:hypothetical protein